MVAAGLGAVWLLTSGAQQTLEIKAALTEYGRGLLQGLGGDEHPVIGYDTVLVDRGSIRKVVATSGPVRALVTVSIGSQISGQIDKLNVDFNSEVQAGDIIALIDSRTYESRVAQAKADVQAAEAGLNSQNAALKRAEAVRRQAESNIGRQKALQQKGIVAAATLDNASRDADVATAEQDTARAQIDIAKAVVLQKQAVLRQAEVDLERTRIVAPVSGTVISRTVDVGQTVAASLQSPELFKIAQDLRRIRIEAQVNEADVGHVAAGNSVTFTVDAYPGRTFRGTVTAVRLTATEIQNVVTYTVIIEAPNSDRKLYPGMTANAQIEVAYKSQVVRVPNDALRFRPRMDTSASGGNRAAQLLSRLKNEVQLTPDQEKAVVDRMNQIAEAQSAGLQKLPGTSDKTELRQRFLIAVEQALEPTVTSVQRPLFEQWKLGRDIPGAGGVQVLDERGQMVRRLVRLGVSDDQFTEVEGVGENERVVVSARQIEK